jgi:hypothetical protein
MASNDNDSEVTTRRRRGRRPEPAPATDGNPGLMRLLWADLRKRPISSPPSAEELALMEEEEDLRREQEALLERAATVGDAKVDQWRMRYGAN